MAGASSPCIFCQIARSSTSTTLLHSVRLRHRAAPLFLLAFALLYFLVFPIAQLNAGSVPLFRFRPPDPLWLLQDELVVAFQDINPSAFRHYLVIPKDHIPTVRDLKRGEKDYSLVSHMLNVGQTLLNRDAPRTEYRFGFHQPPMNSVDHLHLHCLALPFIPIWRQIKYTPVGPFGFIEAEKLLRKLEPMTLTPNQ